MTILNVLRIKRICGQFDVTIYCGVDKRQWNNIVFFIRTSRVCTIVINTTVIVKRHVKFLVCLHGEYQIEI